MSEIYPIAVPKWGIEMVEGTIASWNYELGATISKGDEVFEMESDKIVNVWDSPVDGVLRRRLVVEGETMPVGALLGVIAGADVDDAAIDEFVAGFSGGTAGDKAKAEPAAAPAAPPTPGGDAWTRSSPSVRNLARDLDVDLNAVTGTGRRGRITEEDVRAAASGGGEAAGADVEIIPLTPIRKTIGRRMTEAKQQIPHFYLTAEFELDGLLAHRKSLNGDGGQKVSVNDLLVWCVARALMQVPAVNVNLVGDAVHQFKHANVAVAIATDDGLFPATVYGADSKSPADIAADTAALAEKAKAGALEKADISNGSFTVSNLGMFGVSTFQAIVNPPMGAILALGKADQRVVVKNGEPAVATMINATLSCDHRVIDGAVGARFLAALGEQIAALG